MGRKAKQLERPNRIFELRDRLGMSQEALAEAANTTSSQISKLEKGERRLTVEWMYRLAPALNVAPSDLMLPGEEEPPPPDPILSVVEAATMPASTIEPADIEIPLPHRSFATCRCSERLAAQSSGRSTASAWSTRWWTTSGARPHWQSR